MWYCVLWWNFTDVSVERLQISTWQQGLTYQKTDFFLLQVEFWFRAKFMSQFSVTVPMRYIKNQNLIDE